MTDHLHELCDFLARVGLKDIPGDALDRARSIVADTVAAIAGGSAEPEVRALTAKMAAQGPGKATVVGPGLDLTPSTAAFLNGTAGTFLETDEGAPFSLGHPGIHAVPASLAFAESRASSGEQFILAMMLGYEVGARIGIGSRMRPAMHPHGTWGTVGAAVAVAKLAGADAMRMREAINIASSLSLGTSRQTMLEGGTVRNSFAGFSGKIGVMVWDMVEAGFSGERDGLATVWASVLSDRWDPSALTDQLGTRWEVARNYFKRHACCRYNHGALDILEDLRAAHDFRPHDVRGVRVETYSLAAQLTDKSPRNTLAAKFSLPFSVATALVNGHAGLDAFTWEMLRREDILALAAKVAVAEDERLTAMLPGLRPARLTLELRDGRVLTGFTETNRGDSGDPLGPEVLVDKYYELTTRVWSRGMAEAVLDGIGRIECYADITELTASMRPERRH